MTSHLPPETELVMLLCRSPIADDTRDRILALLARQVDWNGFLRHTAGWEVEAIVCSNLRGQFAEAIPPTAVRAVAERERESRARTLARSLVTVSLAAKFERHGIATLVLKGPAVGVAVYGDPSLRPFADIDLLVKREDLPAARDLLLSLGYRPEYASSHEPSLIGDQHALEFSDSRTKVELHWALLERHLRLEISAKELWSAALRVPCTGGSIRVLAPEHLFLFLCAHGAKHEWERPRWICDVAQLLQRLEPDTAARILDIAARTHSRRLVALALRLARDILGVALFPFREEALVPESDTRRLVEVVRQRARLTDAHSRSAPDMFSRLDPGLGPLVFWARTRERVVDRIACVAHVLLVPTVADEGPHALRWARRPLRLAVRLLRRPTAA
jgi:hypothetical protein